MFLRILLVAFLALGLSSAKPPSVVQYLGVPGNTKNEPIVQFVDLGEPLINEYKDEHIGLNIPQQPQPQTAVTPKPLIIEYSHNPLNNHYKLPPKNIQVIEVPGRRVRQVPADINESNLVYIPIINLPQQPPSFFKTKRSTNNENLSRRKFQRNYYSHQRTLQPQYTEDTLAITTTHKAPTKLVPEYYRDLVEDISESPELQSHTDELIEEDDEAENKKAIEEEFKKQAESAQYQFASNVNDGISGNHHNREETRDGLNVKGSYSYSDGYFRHTIHYVADDKGYRVVKQEHEPLMGDGPKYNPEGEASVATYMDGKTLQYRVNEDDYAPHTKLREEMATVRKQRPLWDSSQDFAEETELTSI